MPATINTVTVEGGYLQATITWTYTDPYEGGPSKLRTEIFIIEYSLSADLSGSQTITVAAPNNTVIRAIPAGTVLYARVHAMDYYGAHGAWSGIASGAEVSAVSPWSGSFLAGTFAISVGAGSISASGTTLRYRVTGKAVFFHSQFTISALTGASGRIRVGNIPSQIRSGGKFAANAVDVTGAGSNILLAAAVVDAGGGNTAIDLYKYDGTFAGVVGHQYMLSGLYETS